MKEYRPCTTANLQRVLFYSLILGLSLMTARVSAQGYSLDDWMSVSTVNAFQWSTDGQYFYYTSNAAPSGTYDVFRVGINGGEPQLLGQDEPGVRPEHKEQLTLSPDGKSIFYSASRYYSAFHNIYRMSAAGGPGEMLTYNDAVIQTSPAVSPDNKTLALFARTGAGAKLYTLDLTADKAWPVQLFPGKGQEYFPAWSSRGDLAFSRGGDIWVKLRDEGSPQRVISEAYGGGNSDFAWSPEGDRIAFIHDRTGYPQVGVVDVASGEVTVVTDSQLHHGQVSWSPDGRTLLFVRSEESGMSDHVIMARADGSGEPRVMTAGKGKRFDPRFSPNGKFLAFIESNSTRTRDIWTIELANGQKRQVTDSMGSIDPATLTEAREIFYIAEDTIKVPGMMWLPPDFDPSKKYPVLVRLHGHPGQWNHDFRMMTQYFVSQGYIAVAPNPRGSVGFGQGFHDLHIGDYGGGDYTDTMGVVPFMESLGYIDMDRMVTWGGSWGGYMSMLVATRTGDTFKGQVIRAPVTNWKTLVNDRHDSRARAWTATRTPSRSRAELGGSYEELAEEYEARSPTNFTENVEVPQLIFHGMRDTNVLPRQSYLWVEAMENAGKGELVELVKYPDEDHGLRRYKATIRDRLERMQVFFSEHIGRP